MGDWWGPVFLGVILGAVTARTLYLLGRLVTIATEVRMDLRAELGAWRVDRRNHQAWQRRVHAEDRADREQREHQEDREHQDALDRGVWVGSRVWVPRRQPDAGQDPVEDPGDVR